MFVCDAETEHWMPQIINKIDYIKEKIGESAGCDSVGDGTSIHSWHTLKLKRKISFFALTKSPIDLFELRPKLIEILHWPKSDRMYTFDSSNTLHAMQPDCVIMIVFEI